MPESPADLAEPVVVLSDVHLSSRSDWARRIDSLRSLWKGAATVVFNGDTMNGPLACNPSRRQEVVAYIRAVCADDGAEAVMIGGNSDFPICGPKHVFLSGRKVLVTHGEVLFEDSSPWRYDSRRLGQARRLARQELSERFDDTLERKLAESLRALRICYDRDDPQTGGLLTAAARRYLRWLARPGRILAVMKAWWRMGRLAGDFLDNYAPQADIIIIGHSHRSGIWRRGRRTVINTGSFEFPARPLAVYVDQGKLEVRKAIRRHGMYVPGKALITIGL